MKFKCLIFIISLCFIITGNISGFKASTPDTNEFEKDDHGSGITATIDKELNDVFTNLILLGVVVYFIVDDVTDDPNYQTRLINDFQRGNGLRVTSYENPVNVSLLSIRKSHPDFEQPAFLNSKYSSKPVNLNLIRVSYDW